MLQRFFLRGAGLLLITLLVSACSSTPRALTPELSSQLEERVRDRWQALIARDFEKAWEFNTPKYREAFPRELYVQRFSYGVEWELTGVEIVNYDGNAAVASVTARVMSKPVKQTSRASRLIGATPSAMSERWLFIDGQWWYSFN